MPTMAEQESALLRNIAGMPLNMPNDLILAGWRQCEKYYSDVAVLTTGASPVTLFTVTGLVVVVIVGQASALTSTSDTGTLAVGVSGATTGILGTTTVNTTNFPTGGAVWTDTSPTLLGEVLASPNSLGYLTGNNIILTIATNSMLTGTLRFCCRWYPMSSTGNVVPA